LQVKTINSVLKLIEKVERGEEQFPAFRILRKDRKSNSLAKGNLVVDWDSINQEFFAWLKQAIEQSHNEVRFDRVMMQDLISPKPRPRVTTLVRETYACLTDLYPRLPVTARLVITGYIMVISGVIELEGDNKESFSADYPLAKLADEHLREVVRGIVRRDRDEPLPVPPHRAFL
jgi:hypothetical protein